MKFAEQRDRFVIAGFARLLADQADKGLPLPQLRQYMGELIEAFTEAHERLNPVPPPSPRPAAKANTGKPRQRRKPKSQRKSPGRGVEGRQPQQLVRQEGKGELLTWTSC